VSAAPQLPAAPVVEANKSAPSATPDPTTPEKLAEVWLDTLGTKDLAALSKLTRTPFVLYDPALPRKCASRTAREEADLPDVLGCELANKLLVEDVAGPFNRPHTGFLLDGKDTPQWAKRWQEEIGLGVVPIGIGLVGAGVFHEMVILAGPDGVHGFWRKASYDSD
jgi:hypothetical protein